jgi:hypothetical protein
MGNCSAVLPLVEAWKLCTGRWQIPRLSMSRMGETLGLGRILAVVVLGHLCGMPGSKLAVAAPRSSGTREE